MNTLREQFYQFTTILPIQQTWRTQMPLAVSWWEVIFLSFQSSLPNRGVSFPTALPLKTLVILWFYFKRYITPFLSIEHIILFVIHSFWCFFIKRRPGSLSWFLPNLFLIGGLNSSQGLVNLFWFDWSYFIRCLLFPSIESNPLLVHSFWCFHHHI